MKPPLTCFYIYFFCFCTLSAHPAFGQNLSALKHDIILPSDTTYPSQFINILSLSKDALTHYSIDIVFADTLTRTSDFGSIHNAQVAINGGFFNMEAFHSVSYLERNDTVYAYTENEAQKRISPSPMLNASLIVEKEGDIIIEYEKEDSFYLASQKEKAVLGAGPLLLENGQKSFIEAKSFSSNRHPRTCVCETSDSILFITIDGRRDDALGMSLYELQDFLISLKCIDAINMDGGGSTTMWVKDKGIVNQPSNFYGERPVANAIILRKLR